MSNWRRGEQIDLIHSLKIMKGALKRPPQVADVEWAHRKRPKLVPPSNYFIEKLGERSWGRVLDLIKGSAITYSEGEGEDDELWVLMLERAKQGSAEELAASGATRKKQSSFFDVSKVEAVAPEVQAAIEEIEKERQHK